MRLVFVHGRDQQGKDPGKLQKEWESALRRGLSATGATLPQGVEIAFPFYGDALEKLVKQVDAPLITGIATRGGKAPSKSDLAFRASIYLEMAKRRKITVKNIEKHYKGPAKERGIQNSAWVLAISRALDLTPLGQKAIDQFTRDVYVYLTFEGVQDQIDEIVAKEIYKGPCVVVAHSLGTIVAYRVLRNAPGDLRVSLYETVGSPLGISAIRKALGYVSMPDCTRRWFNARDSQDIVALYELDRDHFRTKPAIENLSKVKNHTNNHHGIDGYLDNSTVARRIADALI